MLHDLGVRLPYSVKSISGLCLCNTMQGQHGKWSQMLYSLHDCQTAMPVIRPEYVQHDSIVGPPQWCGTKLAYMQRHPAMHLYMFRNFLLLLAWGKCQDGRDGNCSCDCGQAVVHADVHTYACLNAAALEHGYDAACSAHQLALVLKALRAGCFQPLQSSCLQQLLEFPSRIQIHL